MDDTNKTITLFWTGGWDSTFQLLQLLIIQKKAVRPIYIIDHKRRSTKAEIHAMQQIRDAVFKEYSFTKDLLLPLETFKLVDIPKDSDIEAADKTIAQENRIGSQYEWLARFCKHKNLSKVQMCIFKNGRVDQAIKKYVTTSPLDNELVYIDEKHNDTDVYKLFKYYTFPTYHTSKSEINTITKKQGLEKIMDLTWFCHKPTKSMKPCGKCNPCLYTTKVGMAYRIPWFNRLKGLMKKYKKALKGK